MAYNKTVWVNNSAPPISAEQLNKIEQGIYDAHESIAEHAGRTGNPHNTTAAQVGALVSIDGVSNPGGNVDLVAGTGLAITPDNTNKRVTIGADLSYLDGRYVNADGDTVTGTLTASRFAQSSGCISFLGDDVVDPYLRAEDIVFDVLQGRPPASAEQWNGTGWVAIDTSAFRNLFRGGGFSGHYEMTNGSGAIRLTWNNMPYSYFQKLVVYCSTNGSVLSVKCETSADGTTWTEQFTTPNHGTWPGWIMRHGFFHNGGQTPYFRLTFTPTWNGANPIDLYYVRYFCSFSTFSKLTPFSWDVDRVVSFVQTPKVGASVIWHAGNDGAGSGLDADTVDGRHAGAAGGLATLDANSKVVQRLAYEAVAGGVPTLNASGLVEQDSAYTSGVSGFSPGTVKAALDALASRVFDANQKAYWKDLAALLDPAAYTLYYGSTFSVTVPAGETWYALNLWHVRVGTSNYLFQRVADVRRPLILPAGTTVRADGTQTAVAYICKPSTVWSDSRYTQDPAGLYFGRLERLKTLTQYELEAFIPSGSARGTYVRSSFPTDFSKGLIVLVSCHDAAWVILRDPVTGGAINTLSEISDDHQQRSAEAVMIPFQRSVFPAIEIRAASVTGEDAGFSSLAGRGAVKYFKLPEDW